MKTFNVLVVALVFACNANAADALTEKLQRGLFEEEANHNLDAAIKEYQSVVSQADEQRKVMATALFRLGECYRKLGRSNEANAHYERILRDFSEQEQLVKLSRLQLPSRAREAGRLPGAVAEDHASVKLLREEIALAEQQVRGVETRMNAGKSTLDEVLRVKQDVLRLKRMLPENAPPAQQKAVLEEQVAIVQKLLNETQRRVEVGILAPGEDVSLKRELLALQRELSVVSDVATSSGTTSTSPEGSMTQAEAEALARAKTLARNSPDLLQNPTREGLGELQLGARDGFYSVVEFILAQGVSANGPERGTPPIVLAAKTGHLRIVQLLLDKGADVNAIGGGYTALMNACENGYRAVVELLLQRGADVNRVGSTTALHKVAAKGYAGIAELLLAHGAKPDALIGSNQETPLQMAVNNGFADVAELLLKAGADVTIGDRAGVTALHTTANRGNTNLAARLLDNGAKPNVEDAEGKTPLFNALNGYRPVEMVRLLLARGADVNQRHVIKRNGQTMSHYPLIEAVAAGQREIVDAMIEAKADLSVVNQDLTPLMVSVRVDRIDIVESLLRAGANPNQATRSESPALFYAASASLRQAADIVTALLKQGADPNLVNRNGQTPLVVATQPEILQLLLDYKADPNKGNPLPELLRRRTASGWPAAPLPGAPGYGAPQKPSDYPNIEVLLKGGANPNATFGDGTRLLMWAVSTQDGMLVELLLKHSVEVNFVGNNETPLSLAQRNVQSATASRSSAQAIEQAEQIEKALRKHGANEYLQRLSGISYTRPNWPGANNSRTVFTRGTNDYNRHTLFEMLAAVFTGNDQSALPAFPDLSRVTIERLEGANPKRKELALNIDELIRAGDCSNNLWLEWGDRLSFPETDHTLNELWRGLPEETLEVITRCLARRVNIIVKQETNVVKLTQNWNRQLGGINQNWNRPSGGINYGLPPASLPGAFPGAAIGEPIRASRQPGAEAPAKEKPEKTLYTFRLKEVVYGANVLRASSDPTRVRVIRRDSDTVKEWVFDLNRLATANEWNILATQSQGRHLPPWEDLWLRDGDVIEIPEKQ